MSSNNYGWQVIDRHELLLRGHNGFVKFIADSVLAASDKLASPDAIGLTVQVHIERTDSSPAVEIVTNTAFYGSLSSLAGNIRALQLEACAEVEISCAGLRLRIYQHQINSRAAVCVSGDVSSIIEMNDFPWPQYDIGDKVLLEREAAFNLRFAFQTSLIDPPHVAKFLEDIDQLLEYLRASNAD